MRLFDAILDANHRAIGGDPNAGVRPADFENELPVVALTCIDARLNALFPNVLGLPGDEFIWLRNAGNIVTGPLSSTMRSLALACAVKGGKEIAIIGHTDCLVGKMTAMQLLDRLKAVGIVRERLPENLTDFFGLFGSEQQNVIKACDFVRHSPLIGPKIPVHGLMVDIQTGRLEWVVNGYDNLDIGSSQWNEVVSSAGHTLDALKSMADFQIGEMKFPETKIGQSVVQAEEWLSRKIGELEIKPPAPGEPPSKLQSALGVAERMVDIAQQHWPKPETAHEPPKPPKIPLAPPPRPRMHLRKGGK